MKRRERNRPSRETQARVLGLWGLVAAVCLMALWLGQTLCRAGDVLEAERTAVPNDSFAQDFAAAKKAAGYYAGGPKDEEPGAEAAAQALKVVCLTFDDGPSNHTPEILQVLAKYEVPATFFVTAQDANLSYMSYIKDIDEAGHQIALHSASHNYSDIYRSPEAFWMDLKSLRQQLAPYTDVEAIHWLRFPGGSSNTVSHRYGGRDIMKTLVREAEEKGYHWIDWNISAEDATAKHPDAAQIFRNVQKDTKVKGEDICVVLMHDTKATGQTVKALPDIIEWYSAEGYHFCTVADMEQMKTGD